jgi:hypothetical protein
LTSAEAKCVRPHESVTQRTLNSRSPIQLTTNAG